MHLDAGGQRPDARRTPRQHVPHLPEDADLDAQVPAQFFEDMTPPSERVVPQLDHFADEAEQRSDVRQAQPL